MKSSINDLPVLRDNPQVMSRAVEWGSMTINAVEVRQTVDVAPLLKGLPDDRCQCPHWGYVIKGRMGIKLPDHEEVCVAGDLYYIPPGHTVVIEEGTKYIEFSPTDELEKTMEVIERNLPDMQ